MKLIHTGLCLSALLLLTGVASGTPTCRWSLVSDSDGAKLSLPAAGFHFPSGPLQGCELLPVKSIGIEAPMYSREIRCEEGDVIAFCESGEKDVSRSVRGVHMECQF